VSIDKICSEHFIIQDFTFTLRLNQCTIALMCTSVR